jgi:phosphoribosylformylglycinamidine synthase subunit PurS
MTYIVEIKVMPLKELLDPQGKAVLGGLSNLGLSAIQDVRVGKNITVQVAADSPEEAKATARTAAEKLLANPVMEYFELTCRPA